MEVDDKASDIVHLVHKALFFSFSSDFLNPSSHVNILGTNLSSQLNEVLRATSIATKAVNARGDTVTAHLQDFPRRIEKLAAHGVARGAATALTLAHMESPGNNFLGLDPNPPGLDCDKVVEL